MPWGSWLDEHFLHLVIVSPEDKDRVASFRAKLTVQKETYRGRIVAQPPFMLLLVHQIKIKNLLPRIVRIRRQEVGQNMVR
jgi:hypothetical protein